MPPRTHHSFRRGLSAIAAITLMSASLTSLSWATGDEAQSQQLPDNISVEEIPEQSGAVPVPTEGEVEKTSSTSVTSAPSIDRSAPQGAASSEKTTPPRMLNLTITRTDDLGPTVYAGDRLTFDINYTNTTDRALTAFPRTSNLSNVAVTPNSGACRWANLQPGHTKTCHSGYYQVSADDVNAGTFTPTATFDATADRNGTDILDAGIVVEGATIEVKDGERPATPDPSEIPTNRSPGESVVLARSGEKGFECYRIPALTTATNGWILAAWDGRPGGCGDAPNPNSIVQRISKDGGKSWLPQKVVAAGKPGDSKHGYSDPSYVTDRETGEIFMFFVKSYDNGIFRPHPGVDPDDRQVLHAAVMSSKDNGETWSEPRVITADITGDPATWAGRFAASGEGIQLRYGPHAGRLVQQYTVRIGTTFKAVSVYSDDHGASWQAGEPFGTAMDENKVVELSDGRLMVNSRTSNGTQQLRKVAISEDGGQTYGPVRLESQLLDPRNNASIIRAFPNAPQGSAEAKILLFSNAHATSRVNGTVHVSFDDGATWSQRKVFEPGTMQYSTLTPLPQAGHYGLLYEHPNGAISYTEITLDWLGLMPLVPGGVARDVYRGGNLITLNVANLSPNTITGATLTATAPKGWAWQQDSRIEEEVSLPVDTIAANGTFTTRAKLLVPGGTDPGEVTIPVTVHHDGKEAHGSVTVTVMLKENERASHCAANVSVANEADLPAEMVNEQTPVSNMLDGDPTTMWHTPWAGITLPLDVDFVVPREPGLTKAQFLPRASGDNGRIETMEIYLLEGGKETPIGGGQVPRNGDVPIALPEGYGTASTEPLTIRARITSTLGNVKNKWVSVAEACFRLTDQTPPSHDEVEPTPLEPALPVPGPTPSTPTPTEPTPSEPAPTIPVPTDPMPTDPTPTASTPPTPAPSATAGPITPGLPVTGSEIAGLVTLAVLMFTGSSALIIRRQR